jgi:hypothetical protein
MNVRLLASPRAAFSALTALGIAILAACSSSSTDSGSDCHAGDYTQCACDDGSTGKKACGETTCECAVKTTDAGATHVTDAGTTTTTEPGDGGHLHDSGTVESDAAPGTYGATCALDKDCTDPVFNKCFLGGNRAFCTKECATSTDCPAPPTAGVCNKQNRCK